MNADSQPSPRETLTIIEEATVRAMVAALYNQIEAFVNISAPASYTPTWGNTGTANTLGAGTIVGSFQQIGKRVYFTIVLTWGAGTASGSGVWMFTIHVASTAGFPVAQVKAFDTSAPATVLGIRA